MAAAGGAAGSLTTSQIAWKLLPLYFTHINQAILTTMPFTLAVYMVRDFESAKGEAASEQTIGRLTGLLGAVFCAAQLVTSYPWGRLSDVVGRKPVLVVGNVSCVISVLLFGLAGSYGQAIASRAVGGALNAIILCEKAMIGEGLPDKASQAKAFGLLSLCWGLGALGGPIIGGSLSAPCTSALRIDALCGPSSWLVQRPYFPPCLLAALLSAAATLMTITGLDETLPRLCSWPGGRGGKGSAQYQLVPTSDDPEAAAEAAAADRHQELELGAVKQSTYGGSGRDSSGREGSSAGAGDKLGKGAWRSDSAWSSPAALDADADAAVQEADSTGGGTPAAQLPPAGVNARQKGSSMGTGNGVKGRGSVDSVESLETVVLVEAEAGAGVAAGPGQWCHQLAPAGPALPTDTLLVMPTAGTSAASELETGPPTAVAATKAAVAPAAAAAAERPWYKQRTVLLSLLGYGLIAWCFCLLDEIIPIFASAGVAEGGLGYSPSQLAPSLSFGGLVLVVWALRGFPWLMGRVGVVRALRIGLYQTGPLTLLIPCASLLGGAMLPSQVFMFATMGFKALAATNSFTACLIMVNAVAPSDSLGAVNGVGQSIASLVRALGPALGGLSWAWSLQLAEMRWWPAWLPHQFLPFGLAGVMALGTDAVYWNLQMPDAEEV